MSTKTTIKRIALVAVAALGMGMLSTTAAVAGRTAHTVYTSAISVSTDTAPVAGSIGTMVTHTVRFSTSTTAAVATTPSVILTAKPAGSVMASQSATTSVASGKFQVSKVAAVGSSTEGNFDDVTSIFLEQA